MSENLIERVSEKQINEEPEEDESRKRDKVKTKDGASQSARGGGSGGMLKEKVK